MDKQREFNKSFVRLMLAMCKLEWTKQESVSKNK